jgi:hypothetical protein
MLTNVGTQALESNQEFHSVQEAIMKSLFLWVGCIQIDKVCRLVDAHGKPFNKEYNILIHSELVELSTINPWIKRGFSSARFFATIKLHSSRLLQAPFTTIEVELDFNLGDKLNVSRMYPCSDWRNKGGTETTIIWS